MTATTDLAVNGAGSLEANPVEYMAVVLNRAKQWLSEARNIDEIRANKAIAVGYESVIREKELAFDAQLSATEIVRRCERRIGELVREGQREGNIRGRGRLKVNEHRGDDISPYEAAGIHVKSQKTLTQHYQMASVPADEFEQAIEDAREEGNLSRANVVRKVKGDDGPAKTRHYRTKGDPDYHKRHVDPERVLLALRLEMDTMDAGLEHLQRAEIDPALMQECAESIRASWARINKQLRRLGA